MHLNQPHLRRSKASTSVNGAAQAVPTNTRWPGLTTSAAASAGKSLFEICSRDDPKPRISAYFTAVSLNCVDAYCLVVSRSYLSVGFPGLKYRVGDAPRLCPLWVKSGLRRKGLSGLGETKFHLRTLLDARLKPTSDCKSTTTQILFTIGEGQIKYQTPSVTLFRQEHQTVVCVWESGKTPGCRASWGPSAMSRGIVVVSLSTAGFDQT